MKYHGIVYDTDTASKLAISQFVTDDPTVLDAVRSRVGPTK
jgi:hypothetical protein